MVRQAALALEDGSVFVGEAFGASTDVAGEVVFNTGMTGYQEVLTDPSYRGQMVVMTHPQIGNYGVSSSGAESVRPWAAAMIVRELAEAPNHWESTGRFEDELARTGVPGLQGIDTRALVRRIRERGTLRGVLRQAGPNGFTAEDLERLKVEARQAPSVTQLDLVSEVSGMLPLNGSGESGDAATTSEGRPATVAVLDLGAKWNILRSLSQRPRVQTRVFPWDASADEILEQRPDAIVISNGPGDPARLETVVEQVRALAYSGTPMLGICLGHQLLGLAAGATTSRLRYGHHGGNHPVRDLSSGTVTITTQNHEFQVDADSLPADSGFEVSMVNLNDGSVEGLRHRELPVFSVQYHPEGCPGPQDSQELFDRLLAMAPGSADDGPSSATQSPGRANGPESLHERAGR